MPQKFRRTPEEWIAAVLMTLVVVLLGVQVFMRFVLDRSPSWLEEVARFAFVWAIYFGFVIAVEKGRHIRVTLQIRMLSPLWQKIMLTMADVAWIVFNVVVIYHGILFVSSMFEFPFISQTTGINLVWIQMIVPIGFLLMTARIVQSVVRRWREGEELHDSRIDD